MTNRPVNLNTETSLLTAQPLTVRIPEACRLTGIGRSKLYELIKEQRIQTIKVGAITLIPFASLQSFLGLKHP